MWRLCRFTKSEKKVWLKFGSIRVSKYLICFQIDNRRLLIFLNLSANYDWTRIIKFYVRFVFVNLSPRSKNQDTPGPRTQDLSVSRPSKEEMKETSFLVLMSSKTMNHLFEKCGVENIRLKDIQISAWLPN